MNEHEEKFYMEGIESQVVNQGWAFCLLPDGSNFSITLSKKWNGRVYNQEQGATFWEADNLAELFTLGREKTGKDLKLDDFYEKGSLAWGQRDHRNAPEFHRRHDWNLSRYDGYSPTLRSAEIQPILQVEDHAPFHRVVQRWLRESKALSEIELDLGENG